MATNTTNYNLIKPDYEDDADIKDLNDNFDSIDALIAEDRAALVELVDGGAKNFIIVTATSQTVSDVVFTVNSDGTITTSGSLPTNTPAVLTIAEFDLPAGTYHYSCEGGGVQNERDSYVQAYDGASWNSLARDYEDSDFTISATTHIRVRVRVYRDHESGTFKPMICTEAAWNISHAYQPYRPSYQELYERVVALENA